MPRTLLAAAALAAAALAGGASAQSDSTAPATCAAPGTQLQSPETFTDDKDWTLTAKINEWRANFVSSLDTSGANDLGAEGLTVPLAPLGDAAILASGGWRSEGFMADEGPAVITFSQPQQAVGIVMTGADNWFGGQMTVECGNPSGLAEAVPLVLPPENSNRPAFYSTVRDAANPGDWCKTITITPASNNDGVIVDDIVVGTCATGGGGGGPDTVRAPCDCPSTKASTGGASVQISFGEGPYDAECL